MKKRLISLLLAFSMMLTFLPAGAVSAFAEESLGPYDCGKKPGTVTATLSRNNDGGETYTMTIRGTGPMKNYDFLSCRDMPWRDAILKITRLIVDDGVTSLGDCVLHGFDGGHDARNLMEVTLPEGLTYLGNYAFFGAAKLKSITLPSTLTTIGLGAFDECAGLTDITIPSDVKTIKEGAFGGTGLTSVTIPDKVETLGQDVFENCTQLTSIHIPKSVKSMGAEMFGYCTALTCITFEPGSNLTYVGGSNGDWNLFTRTSPELKVYCEPGLKSKLSGRGVPDERIITTVDVTLVDGDTITPKKIDYGADITALDKDKPIKPGYTFKGWYTDPACKNRYPDAQLFTNINGTTLYAGWATSDLTVKNGTISVVASDGTPLAIELKNGQAKVPAGATVTVTFDRAAVADNDLKFDHWSISGLNEDEKPKDTSQEEITFTVPADRDAIAIEAVCKSDKTPDANTEYQLSVTGGIVTVKNGDKDVTDTLTVTTDETTGKKTYSVPKDAKVTVTLDKDKIPEGMVFDIWSTGKFSLPLGQDYKAETITFPMSSDVDIAAQYRDATIEDDGPGVLGTAAIIGTAAVGGAVLGYQAYSLGAEFAGKLMALPYFPSNRSALAMMLWEDAGKPMPESELLYPDVGQEERDMDLQHAARWAMENELIPDLNDEGTAPEEMKFYPDNTVSKIDVLKAWQKAQELKQNA
nr:leucine-rich repeat protein [Faecalibacterium hominis (ex Afrizal et al. 2022)]